MNVALVWWLQVNWFQLSDAAAFVSRHPDVPVIVNHLGCLKLGTT